MKYKIVRTETADIGLRKIILYIAERFGNIAALEKLNEIESKIMQLAEEPYIGVEPRYLVLKRQGHRVLILEKNLAFYKIIRRYSVYCLYGDNYLLTSILKCKE